MVTRKAVKATLAKKKVKKVVKKVDDKVSLLNKAGLQLAALVVLYPTFNLVGTLLAYKIYSLLQFISVV